MVSVSLKLTGINETIANLKKLKPRLSNNSEFMTEQIVPELKKQFRKVFDTEGYGRWPPLKRSTIISNRRRGLSTRMNVDTGRYRSECERLVGMSISHSSTATRLRIISPNPYARYLEPVRPVFGPVADEVRKVIVRLYRIHLRRKVLR